MKISRFIAAAAFAVGIVFVSTGCSLFDSGAEDVPGLYYDDGSMISKTTENQKTKSSDVNIENLKNNISDGVPPYSDTLGDGGDYAPGFGKRIAGVTFEAVYFQFDQNIIPMSETYKISAVADYLEKNPRAGVVVEGNCDDRGTEEYNRALGERRANSAKLALMDLGISESRIGTISYGENKPSVQGESEDAWKLNRRDEFVPVMLKN